MDEMREIGRRIQVEQNLTADDIVWLTTIAQAILRAFIWRAGQPMRTLATTLGVAPQTLYTALRLAVQALVWVRQHKTAVTTLVSQLQGLQRRGAELAQRVSALHAAVQRVTQALAAAQRQLRALQTEVTRLPGAWTVMQERLIVVLKLSGRGTVRSIVEVLA
jgi:chromosome segregation ATPase